MNYFRIYHMAYSKMANEARQPNINIRLLVGHVNILDSINRAIETSEDQPESEYLEVEEVDWKKPAIVSIPSKPKLSSSHPQKDTNGYRGAAPTSDHTPPAGVVEITKISQTQVCFNFQCYNNAVFPKTRSNRFAENPRNNHIHHSRG